MSKAGGRIKPFTVNSLLTFGRARIQDPSLKGTTHTLSRLEFSPCLWSGGIRRVNVYVSSWIHSFGVPSW
jgi:hypothetical protein